MRIAVCWPVINGYMSACWRALQQHPAVSGLFVVAFDPRKDRQTAYELNLLAGIDHHLLPDGRQSAVDPLVELLASKRPDVLYIPGWGHEPYNKLPLHPRLAGIRMVMGLDTPWLNTWRQRLGRLWLRRYLARMDLIFAIGERAFQSARHLGVPESRIRRHCYAGVDFSNLSQAYEARMESCSRWPRRFLFIGRYAKEKAIDTLVEAYRVYRTKVDQPWPLSCCGKGLLESLLIGVEGVTNHGFIQPPSMADLWRKAAVLVNPARYDPWPLVLVEGGAAGLPLIGSEACGSIVEMIRPYFNGITVATDDVDALVCAMKWMHTHHDRLPAMGAASRELAKGFSAEAWADRWINVLTST